MSFLALLPIVGPIIEKVLDVVDKAVPDKDLAEKLKAEFREHALKADYSVIEQELRAQAEIIVAEAKGEGYIQRNWRPITMLTFVSLIVAKWLGYTAPGVTEAIELALLEIIKYGLSGYVVGRSAEKIAPYLKGAFGK